MASNNVVRCKECLYFNRQFNDCEKKSFEQIDNENCCIRCEKYSQSIEKIFQDFLEGIGMAKLIDFLANKLNSIIDFFKSKMNH